MSYEDVVKGLSGRTAQVIEELWQAVENGRITLDEFVAIAADLISVARVRGAMAAQATLRAYLEAASGQALVAPTAAFTPDRARLVKALGTVLASDQDTLMQLVRIATNEPLDAAAAAYHDAMQGTAMVSGWRRGLEGDACQLCRWWWREGRVWQKTHKMPRHPGCACHQVPVIRERTSNYQTTRQSAGALQTNRQRHTKEFAS